MQEVIFSLQSVEPVFPSSGFILSYGEPPGIPFPTPSRGGMTVFPIPFPSPSSNGFLFCNYSPFLQYSEAGVASSSGARPLQEGGLCHEDFSPPGAPACLAWVLGSLFPIYDSFWQGFLVCIIQIVFALSFVALFQLILAGCLSPTRRSAFNGSIFHANRLPVWFNVSVYDEPNRFSFLLTICRLPGFHALS